MLLFLELIQVLYQVSSLFQTLILPCACYLSILKGKINLFQVKPSSVICYDRTVRLVFPNISVSLFTGLHLYLDHRSWRHSIRFWNLFSPLWNYRELELIFSRKSVSVSWYLRAFHSTCSRKDNLYPSERRMYFSLLRHQVSLSVLDCNMVS